MAEYPPWPWPGALPGTPTGVTPKPGSARATSPPLGVEPHSLSQANPSLEGPGAPGTHRRLSKLLPRGLGDGRVPLGAGLCPCPSTRESSQHPALAGGPGCCPSLPPSTPHRVPEGVRGERGPTGPLPRTLSAGHPCRRGRGPAQATQSPRSAEYGRPGVRGEPSPSPQTCSPGWLAAGCPCRLSRGVWAALSQVERAGAVPSGGGDSAETRSTLLSL